MNEGLLKYRGYLFLTEFLCGMSVMAVELGASRLLAPYFSSSQIVWTIIIATIMIAMALGNVYGGRSADRNPDPDRLYRRILLAAVWTAAIPFLGRYVILGITGILVMTVNRNFLTLAAFAACMVIFVFPCFLLGTCTPSLARYTVSGADDSGRTVGALGAFNTVGSIIGTFLPTFVTIPAVGTAVTFLIFSGVLLLTAILYFVFRGTGRRASLAAAVLFTVFSVLGSRAGFAFWEQDLLYEGESIYNYLQVKDSETSTILSTNVLFGVQSIRMKNGNLTGMYYDYALAAPVMAGRSAGADGNAKILILGMGTGTFAEQCRKYFAGADIRGVEIDGRITELAERYFGAPDDVVTETFDGRAWLTFDSAKYDVIMVDAYQDITIPFQMSSAEFFRSVRSHLAPGGIMVVNMNMRSSSPEGIHVWLEDTIASVFPHVMTMDVPGSTNRELFASETEIDGALLRNRAASAGSAELTELMVREADLLTPYEGTGTHILTDDKAPVELLGMQAIDGIIREELRYYKEVLRTEGIGGLL